MPILPELAGERRPDPTGPRRVATYSPVDTSSVGAIEQRSGAAIKAGADALGVGSRALYAAVQRQEEDDDKTAVDAAVVRARGEQQRLMQQVLDQRGENAVKGKLYATYGKQFDDALGKIAGELENDRQRERFTARGGVLKLQFGGDTLNHVRAEGDAHAKQTHLAMVETWTDAAIAGHADSGTVETSIGFIRQSTLDFAERQGWAPETTKAVLAEQMSEVHVGVVEHKLVVDPAGAKAYYAEHKGEIQATERTRLREAMKISDVQQKSQTIVDGIIADVDANANDWAGQRRTVMDKAYAVKDAAVRDKVVGRARQRLNEIEDQRTRQTSQFVDQGYAMAMQGQDISPVMTEFLRRRSPKDLRAMEGLLIQGAPPTSVPETLARLWDMRRAAFRDGYGSPAASAYLEYDLRRDYQQLEENGREEWHARQAGDEIALRGATQKSLDAARQAAAKNIATSYSTIRGNIDTELRAANIDPEAKEGDDVQRLNAFERRLFTEVELWHLENEGKMPAQVQTMITRELLDVAVKESWWPGRQKRLAFEMGEDISEIPEGERDAVRADLMAIGISPTPGMMLKAYRIQKASEAQQ